MFAWGVEAGHLTDLLQAAHPDEHLLLSRKEKAGGDDGTQIRGILRDSSGGDDSSHPGEPYEPPRI